MERNGRQGFDGIDAVDEVDSSEDNGRSQGTEGYGGLTNVGGSHLYIFVSSSVDKRVFSQRPTLHIMIVRTFGDMS